MHPIKILAATSVAAFSFAVAAPESQAQIAVNIGPAPVCPYGYYDVAPYNCAPYGYYGPEWFSSGVFIGAGPGSTAPTTSTATSITTSIPSTDITALTLPEARPHVLRTTSTTWRASTATRRATAVATQAANTANSICNPNS